MENDLDLNYVGKYYTYTTHLFEDNHHEWNGLGTPVSWTCAKGIPQPLHFGTASRSHKLVLGIKGQIVCLRNPGDQIIYQHNNSSSYLSKYATRKTQTLV